MDNQKEGYLLIATTMLILLVFLVALTMLMIVYRRRKLEHIQELETMKGKYHKEMLETQLVIQQDTMQEIGREIHDNVGQRLTLASLYTSHLDMQNDGKLTAGRLAEILKLIDESIDDLRSLSHHLIHSPTNSAGLELLLQKEVRAINDAHSSVSTLNTAGPPVEVSLKVKNMILRIAQEFLQNSIKHADCEKIMIDISYQADGIAISMKDDGKGFTNEEKNKAGVGLDNMKKRASIIGADFNLNSSPGQGTTLNLFIPSGKENL